MMFNYLTNRVEEMTVDIADAPNELVDFFLKEGRFDEPLTNPGTSKPGTAGAPAPGPRRRPMGMDVGAKSGVRSDINITPLVDVVLVLLIIFMVITPCSSAAKSVELPKARHAVPGKGEVEPAFISVTKAARSSSSRRSSRPPRKSSSRR